MTNPIISTRTRMTASHLVSHSFHVVDVVFHAGRGKVLANPVRGCPRQAVGRDLGVASFGFLEQPGFVATRWDQNLEDAKIHKENHREADHKQKSEKPTITYASESPPSKK